MRRTITAAAAAALTLGLVAGPAAAGPPASDSTIVETAVAASGPDGVGDGVGSDFDILIAAVTVTTDAGLLELPDEFTLFAPTDQAFIDTAATLDPSITTETEALGAILATFTAEEIADILKYHVTTEDVERADLARPSDITMANGGTVFTKGDMVGPIAQLVDPTIGIEASNGTIYVIDFVLLP